MIILINYKFVYQMPAECDLPISLYIRIRVMKQSDQFITMSWYSINIQDNIDVHFAASHIILKIPLASNSVKIHTINKHVKTIFKILLFHCCFTFFLTTMSCCTSYASTGRLSCLHLLVLAGRIRPNRREAFYQGSGEALTAWRRSHFFTDKAQ